MSKLPFIQKALGIERDILNRTVKARQDLAVLEGQKASLKTEVSLMAGSLTEMEEREKALGIALSNTEEQVKELGEVCGAEFASALEEVKRARSLVDEMTKTIKSRCEILISLKKELEKVTVRKEAVLDEVRAQQAAISKRRAELDAFEAFIKEVYDEELFPLSAFNL